MDNTLSDLFSKWCPSFDDGDECLVLFMKQTETLRLLFTNKHEEHAVLKKTKLDVHINRLKD